MRRSVAQRIVMSTVLVTTFASLSPSGHAADPPAYTGSVFSQVWSQVASDPYASLPETEVTLGSFFGWFTDHLLAASRRTLSDRRDLLPWFRKLLHPSGICFAGTWSITEASEYTGYFRQGSEGLIIVRASTALSATKRGEYRAFGFAGKLFPTSQWFDPQPLPTANFFAIEDLGGSLGDYFLDAENTNDILRVTPTPAAVANGAIGAVAAKDFAIADGAIDPTLVAVRQLYPIAELGEADPAQAKAPRWMMITGSDDVPRVVADDFRDELRVAHYPGGLRFDIYVSDWGTRLGPRLWHKIGVIELFEDAVSDSCDHRLHFSHPRYRY